MAIDVSRYSEARRRILDLTEIVLSAYEDFDKYRDTTYRNLARPAIFWPEGKNIGYGIASHMAGTAQTFYAKFKYWGFISVEDFYCLPIEKRNEFLGNSKAIWEGVFWHSAFQEKTAYDVLNIDRLDLEGLEQTLAALIMSEKEFHDKLTDEAKRIKNECYSKRLLRWKTRNEKARFKAEDKLRERTQCRSDFVHEILLRSFRLQEGIKRLVGLRERFPPKWRI